MLARDLMSGQPAVVTVDETLTRAADLMRTRSVGMLPVVDDHHSRRLRGVITDRDIVVRGVARAHGGEAKVRDHMSTDPLVTALPTTTAEDVAARMREHQLRRLPVVDADGRVIGVVAQADLALLVGPRDPRLVEELIEGISRPGALVRKA